MREIRSQSMIIIHQFFSGTAKLHGAFLNRLPQSSQQARLDKKCKPPDLKLDDPDLAKYFPQLPGVKCNRGGRGLSALPWIVSDNGSFAINPALDGRHVRLIWIGGSSGKKPWFETAHWTVLPKTCD